MKCTVLKPVRDCEQEPSHHFLKHTHLKPRPQSQAVEEAVAAAIQHERMDYSARLASYSRNIGLSSGSLNPGNPMHLRPPGASVFLPSSNFNSEQQ